MDAPALTNACGSHACDCRSVANSETVDGVVLIAERRHVREKVGVLLEPADGLRLEGAGWSGRLQALLDELSFSERAALLAAPLHGRSVGIALPVDDVLTRARTEWLPALLNGSAIYPHLQPIVSLSDGRTFGYESLLRAPPSGKVAKAGRSFSTTARIAPRTGARFIFRRCWTDADATRTPS